MDTFSGPEARHTEALAQAHAPAHRTPSDVQSPEALVASSLQVHFATRAGPGGAAAQSRVDPRGRDSGASDYGDDAIAGIRIVSVASQRVQNRGPHAPLKNSCASSRPVAARRRRRTSWRRAVSARLCPGRRRSGQLVRGTTGRRGFLERFVGGSKVLDIGYKGYDNPKLLTIVPHAIGVDLDYPGYDGRRLPFDDGSVDTVCASHCLEHISGDYVRRDSGLASGSEGRRLPSFAPCRRCTFTRRSELRRRGYNGDHKRFYSPRRLDRRVRGGACGERLPRQVSWKRTTRITLTASVRNNTPAVATKSSSSSRRSDNRPGGLRDRAGLRSGARRGPLRGWRIFVR